MSKIFNSVLKIGNTLKQLRLKAGLTQTALSKKVGIARSHISKIEAGGNISYQTIEKLAKGLGVNINDLTGIKEKETELTDIFIEIDVSDKLLETEEEVLIFKQNKSNEKFFIDKKTWDDIRKKVKKPELIYAYIYPYGDLYPRIRQYECLFIKIVKAKISYDYGERSIKGAKKYNDDIVVIKLKNKKKLIRIFEYPQHFDSYEITEDDPGFIEGEDVDSIIGICVFSISKTLWI